MGMLMRIQVLQESVWDSGTDANPWLQPGGKLLYCFGVLAFELETYLLCRSGDTFSTGWGSIWSSAPGPASVSSNADQTENGEKVGYLW